MFFSLSLAAAPPESVHWTFSEPAFAADDVASLKAAGWQLNVAADRDDAFFVKREKVRGLSDYLVLIDVVNQEEAKVPAADAIPQATLPFAPTPNGQATLKVATEGLQNQVIVISLLAGNKPVGEVKITNNSSGVLVTGAGEQPFKVEDDKWLRNPRELEISWTTEVDGSNGKISISFPDAPDAKVEAAPFITPAGFPDALRLQVGFGKAVNRGLVIDELQITPTGAASP